MARALDGLVAASRPLARIPVNVLFFSLKRAFHGSLRVFRRALASLGLTAARFDLLYIVLKERGLLQRELQRALGVAAPTVSRMLRSLEELGLVVREVAEDDGRQRYVELTKEGRRSVIRAARSLIHSGFVDLTIDSALSPADWYDPSVRWKARHQCLHPLRLLRHAFRDLATPEYPFAHCVDGEDGQPRVSLDDLPPVPLGPTESPMDTPP
jgi:DNA-binding MarR family transcriptional regulator